MRIFIGCGPVWWRINSRLRELHDQLAEIPAWGASHCHPVAPERLWATEHWAPSERAWFLQRAGGSAAFIADDALVDRHSIFDQCSPAGKLFIQGMTKMATVASPAVDGKVSERKFYSRMALFLVLVVLVGFAPSFYLRGIVPPYPRPNPTLPPAVILHGLVFTLWISVIVAQTQLIAARKHEVHMLLGKAGMLLAILMIPVMYMTAAGQVARANQPPFTDPLTWTIVPLAVIIPFAIVVWSGWARRRDAQSHKRLMLSAAIMVVMGPSVGRLPLAPPTMGGITFLLLLGLALFVPLFVWDRRAVGHIHSATRLGFAMAALSVAIPLTVFWLGLPWAKVAARLPGVGA